MIIPQQLSNCQASDWQKALTQVITDPKELLTLLELDINLLDAAKAAAAQFPLRVPRGFIDRMHKGDPRDPLLLQVLPLGKELDKAEGFTQDPLQEQHASPLPGLLHKYQDRVLFTLTGACAINCRYCFRRHFPYNQNNPAMQGWEQAIAYITNNSNIKEIILSGGDPLIVKDHLLLDLLQQLSSISHLKRIRIHSRLPIVLPSRITNSLIETLVSTRLKPVMVIHCNHPNEIDITVRNAIDLLLAAKIPTFNQSVLLKDINDSVSTLVNLSEVLFAAGVIPYYLHLLDKVQGAAHFDIAETTAKQLIREMMQQLPGYMVPKLVNEKPGAPAKIPISIF